MRRTMRACGSQARTPAAASTPSRQSAGRHADRQRVRWSGGRAQPGAGELHDLDLPAEPVRRQRPSRSAERGRAAKKPA